MICILKLNDVYKIITIVVKLCVDSWEAESSNIHFFRYGISQKITEKIFRTGNLPPKIKQKVNIKWNISVFGTILLHFSF